MLKTRFLIQSPNLKLLSLYVLYINKILTKLGIKYIVRSNPILKQKLTLLKSPHVYKKHKEQFLIKKYSICFYFTLLKINKLQFYLFLQNRPKFIDLFIKLER